ncbi:MAG: hypothetical protein FJ271_13525 [Planctomycetes bacterium]|nr:hypothetical protein [Planctomycetota bacterium]
MKECVGLLMLGALTCGVVGQEAPVQVAPKQEETLPAPRAAQAPQVLMPPIMPLVSPYAPPDPPPEFGRRSAWQMYGVDRFGRFRPRVIYSPYGNSYYQMNGAPFPWTTTMPRLYMPYVVD